MLRQKNNQIGVEIITRSLQKQGTALMQPETESDLIEEFKKVS